MKIKKNGKNMARSNNIISKEVKINTTSIKASVTKSQIDDLKVYGMDAEAELEKILMNELNAANFEKFASGITAQNREGKIDSILEDKDFQPTNIEDTEQFKILSDEYKEKWIKHGRIF